jgi:hypothetical protein
MSESICSNCQCPTPEVINVPGAPGVDAEPVAPDVVDPEGVKVGTPGQTYLNSNTGSFWVKQTGTGNTGWLQLIGAVATIMFLLFGSIRASAQPVYRNILTTNTSVFDLTLISNAAVSKIAIDTTKQPASAALTNLVSGNGSVLVSNVAPSALSGLKFTGVITNKSTLMTNWTYYTNGIVATNLSLP